MIHRFDRFELDENTRRLRRDGEPVPLQPLVMNLLVLLVRNHRRVMSKDELRNALWPGTVVTGASLQRAMSLVRTALEDASHELVRTYPRYGYRLCAAVRTLERPAVPAAPESGPEPPVRYARTPDGVRIATWSLGAGPPLVIVPNIIWSHGRLEWRVPEIRRWYERLARGRRLIRFDPRGTGSSQRRPARISIDAVLDDLDAVVDRAGLDTFALFGDLNGGAVAAKFAASRPERVSHLILWHAYARTRDIDGPKMRMLESLQPLMSQDWETYTETRAHMGLGWSDGASAHRYAALLRECTEPDTALRAYKATRREDVTRDLPRIAAPTLVLHRRHFYFWDVQVSEDLAARIPDARLVVLEDAGSAPFLGDSGAVAAAIDTFLGP